MAPPTLTSATTTPREARNPWHRQRPQRTSTPLTPPPPDRDYPQTKNSSTTNNQYTTRGTTPCSVRGISCVVGGDGAWGISSSSCCGAFASWSSALMVAKTSGRVGEAGGWGAGLFQVMWYSSGFSGLCCTVMAAVASSSGVHRCGLWPRGWRVMVCRCFKLWNARRAWRPCLVSPGGRG